MAALEFLRPNEVISCLWSKNAPEKCRIGLADAVVYENGNPMRWYFTGKTGEISKKRAVDMEAISLRWKRVATQSASPYVAVVKQEGGILKFLGEDAWDILCLNKGVTDKSIHSIHCFVKGANEALYRNTFELRDKLGRFVTSTQSFSYGNEGQSVEPVHIVDEKKCKFYESKASNLKNIMDLATHTVIRYVEMMLQVKIIKLSVDYIVDTKSQLWMLWTSDAQFCRVTRIADIQIPGFPSGDKAGRMSWAGEQYREGMMDVTLREGKSPLKGNRDDTVISIAAENTSLPRRRNIEEDKLTSEHANQMIHAASTILDEASIKAQIKRSGEHMHIKNHESEHKHTVEPADPSFEESKFPDPFKCKGDFCRFRVFPTGSLQTDKGLDVTHIQEKLFTQKELEVLRKNKRFNQMMSFGSDGPALAAISQKSIVMARQEQRGGIVGATETEAWKQYPTTPRERHTLKSHLDKLRSTGQLNTLDSQERITDDASTDSVEAQNKSAEETLEESLRRSKEHVDSFTKSVASYYDQVRVCGICFNVYSLLDWSRRALGTDDAHGAGSENMLRTGSAHGKRGGRMKVSESLPNFPSSDVGDEASVNNLTAGNRSRSPSGSPIRSRGRRIRKPEERSTWKTYEKVEKTNPKTLDVKGEKFRNMDEYLRGGAKEVAKRMERKKKTVGRTRVGEMAMSLDGGSSVDTLETTTENLYKGKVLLAHEDSAPAHEARVVLEESFFDVHWSKDGREAINDFHLAKGDFDCVLIQRELPLGNAFDVVKVVRDFEKEERKRETAKAAAAGRGVQIPFKRHPVICYTDATTPEDLRVYMQSDMDGCVSYPLNKASLLNTVRSAVPHHLALLAIPEPPPDPFAPQVFKVGNLGMLEGAQDSATQAFQTLPISSELEGGDDRDAALGVVQIDADTRLPYQVIDMSKYAKVALKENKPFFNIIVCHDLFDTAEKMKIFFKPIAQKYIGLQILLWNYPGQAYTECRDEQLLNNEYHASCLNELLGQIGEKGTKDFDTSRPFYIMGYGHGTSIATFYASYFNVPNLRGVINVNGWSYVDSYLAGVMHDCINIFQYSPPSRPDLPVYFFSRFLFSKEYLAKVSVPLALNVYTAVHNPISLKGRVNLCKGVLQSVDVRPLLQDIDCPIICIQSTQDSLSRPMQMEPFVKNRGGEAKSIYRALQDPSKTCVIWMKSGHEIFQECKKPLRVLFEQLLTGFHETRDVEMPNIAEVDKVFFEQGKTLSNIPGERTKTIEDNFIDVFLGNMNKVTAPENWPDPNKKKPRTGNQAREVGSPNNRMGSPNGRTMSPSGRTTSPSGRTLSPGMTSTNNSAVFSSTDPGAWNEYSQTISESQILGKMPNSKRKKNGKSINGEDSGLVLDPNLTAFERQNSAVYGAQDMELRKMKKSNPAEYAEIKEYMGWRLKRNKKRLQRLQGAARIIQGGFRAYLARMFVRGIRRRKAASKIQRAFRGWVGRCDFLDQARRIWGSQVIQRAWRGYLSRKWYFYVRLRIASAANIQRMYRGHLSRRRVEKIKAIRYKAACMIQALLRRNKAKKDAWRKRQQRNAATLIQRCYRGRLGRRKASSERDKYIFSRSQSQGIEFGRQMLLEHKLHATRLQSDVTLLTQEKVASEEQVEALLEEISTFEDGVRTLEKEMHQLSKVEAEAAAFMDEESKFELREQKMRLDKEFGDMLSKIGQRKEMLGELEKKLAALDKARQGKEEELRTLERKLVVLLEEQQNELNAIKRKQDVRGAMLAASHEEVRKLAVVAPGSNSGSINDASQSLVSSSGGSGGGGGPSLTEKRQAAQLMQSTETLMKFGFMSMSMTYFSSLNMIKALRTVSAQDTVMAALADTHAQKAAGFNPDAGADSGSSGDGAGGGKFLPSLKAGQLPGQESLKVSAWSVDDVAKWLQTLSLGQYVESFTDAAVDGEFLYDLNDDDLKNTLGIEHRLHRKKILNCVHRLKIAEAQADSRINALLKETGGLDEPQIAADEPEITFAEFAQNEDRQRIDGPKISIDELMSLVRHSKFSTIKEALDYLPNKKFDNSLVQSNYVDDYGTVYVPGYEKLPFHINKCDDKGNTMLSLACQNGNEKIAKYLVMKGANTNHQNTQGQSAAHFCIAYKFFELGQWLFENGGIDTLENKEGLTPYDGLSAED